MRVAGLLLGPVLSLLCFAIPESAGLPPSARGALALIVLMAVWWVSEAIPLAATALLPILCIPLLGIPVAFDGRGRLACAESICAAPGAVPPEAARSLGLADLGGWYSNPIVLLYIGGFLLGLAIERSGLSRRLAFGIVAHGGASPRLMVGGFIIAAGFLSMWISNTSTSLILTPLALSVAASLGGRSDRFATSAVLAIAWAATIGGLATPIGTPTNAIAVSQLRSAGIEISFAQWMALGLPVVMILLPIAWLILSRGITVTAAEAAEARTRVRLELQSLGPVSSYEWRTAAVFVTTAGLWVGSSALSDLSQQSLSGGRLDPGHIDTMIATLAALLFFIIPSGQGRQGALLSLPDIRSIPWDILLLFGGGLAVAGAAELSGLSAWIAHSLDGLTTLPPAVVILLIGVLVMIITEFASNIATISIMGPVIMAIAAASGSADTASFMIPAAMAASMGFAMPVGSACNAIAYGTGRVPLRRMIRLGLVFNGACLVVLTLLAVWLFPHLI
jgi:sodium-dependent dicarboxylate transporter 2/3/5